MIHTPKERPDLVLQTLLTKFFKIWLNYGLKNLKLLVHGPRTLVVVLRLRALLIQIFVFL